MNYIFFGTPQFTVIILQTLIEAGYTPALIVTTPDKPKRRGHAMTPPPIKLLAQQHDIPVAQPSTLKNNNEIKDAMAAIRPDLFIVAAYGKIIPKTLLDIPRKGGLNVHPSLLPKYRGPSPIQATILNGDETTGVTIMLMDEEMDHGPILAQRELTLNIQCFSPTLNVERCHTAEKLSEKLAHLGAQLLIGTIPKWLSNEIKPQPQNHGQATYTKIITKEDGHIDWRKSAEDIERMVRAYTPWPSVWTIMCDTKGRATKSYAQKEIVTDAKEIKKNTRIKILRASLPSHFDISIYQNIEMGKEEKENEKEKKNEKSEKSNAPHANHKPLMPGTVLKQNSDLLVACGKDFLMVEELQVEGRKPVSGAEFLRGYEANKTLMFGLK